ncbi:MAG: hypothetical protein KGJ35_01625 [Patescibacteria group bacterium]|nr:hypothetical protein [Patescibacteria group bacterium]
MSYSINEMSPAWRRMSVAKRRKFLERVKFGQDKHTELIQLEEVARERDFSRLPIPAITFLGECFNGGLFSAAARDRQHTALRKVMTDWEQAEQALA